MTDEIVIFILSYEAELAVLRLFSLFVKWVRVVVRFLPVHC